MWVDTEASRSCIASTYDASTAPLSTSSRPASVIASSRDLAVPLQHDRLVGEHVARGA